MRFEEDSLGKIELPSDCLYGVRTSRCLTNLSFSGYQLSQYPELITSLAEVKTACAQANAEAGDLPQEIADLISQQCDSLIRGLHHDHFPVDMLHGGGYIAFNSNINEVVANLANMSVGKSPGVYSPVDPKLHVNCSQSTADACHTASRIAVLRRAKALIDCLNSLSVTARHLERTLRPVQTIARTCLQDAMTVSLGETFSAFASFLDRRKIALTQATELMKQVNLGGTVIGSGDGASPKYRTVAIDRLNDVTGLNLHARSNLFDAAQNIDDLCGISAQLRLLAEGLIKFAKDLRLMSSGPNCGFGELVLPAVQEGSSFFAGKINPVVPETLIQACMQVLGCDRACSAALEHGELNLNVFEGVATKNILDALRMLTSALQLFSAKCLDGITAQAQTCEKYALSVKQPAGNPSRV